MTISYKKGDLFASELPALAHGCNTVGVMGGGIAAEFRYRYPAMYREYRRLCDASEYRLGDVFTWRGYASWVFNLATQPYPGPCASLDAIESSVTRMLQIAEDDGVLRIGLPRIGAGLGGLNWPDVQNVLVETAGDSHIELIVHEL